MATVKDSIVEQIPQLKHGRELNDDNKKEYLQEHNIKSVRPKQNIEHTVYSHTNQENLTKIVDILKETLTGNAVWYSIEAKTKILAQKVKLEISLTIFKDRLIHDDPLREYQMELIEQGLEALSKYEEQESKEEVKEEQREGKND